LGWRQSGKFFSPGLDSPNQLENVEQIRFCATPFVVEVQTTNGPAVFQFVPRAAAVLAEELTSYMSLYSKPAT
jgi:hypothetical protein